MSVSELVTLALAIATALLALFTYRMAQETRSVATATRDLVTAAQEQSRTGSEELAHLRQEAKTAQEPLVVLELEDEPVPQVAQRPGVQLFYVFVAARLVNYGGHAVIDRLHVTGRPHVETRPRDVAGFLPSGGRLPFRLRFDVGNADASIEAAASVPIRARGVRSSEWTEVLFYVNVRFSLEQGGWQAEVGQPLSVIGGR